MRVDSQQFQLFHRNPQITQIDTDNHRTIADCVQMTQIAIAIAIDGCWILSTPAFWDAGSHLASQRRTSSVVARRKPEGR